jgi:hypothetical protein
MRNGLAVVVALVVATGACERDVARQAPAPRDAKHADVDLDQRAAALERVHAKVLATHRERSPLEAPEALTTAYVELEFAYGFARLGKRDRARALVDTARAALGPVLGDPVHATLFGTYLARITGSAEPSVAALDRVGRYKVDRLRERSLVLAPNGRIDAIGGWIDHTVDGRDPAIVAAAELADDGARAAAVAKVVDNIAATPERKRELLLLDSLDVLLGLPPALGAPILDRITSLGATAPVAARAMLVAAHYGRDPPSFDLEVAGPDAPRALADTIRAFVLRGRQHDLAGVMAKTEPRLDDAEPAARLAVAAGWFAAGDGTRARRLIPPALAQLDHEIPVRWLVGARVLAFAYANTSVDIAEPGLEPVLAHLADVTDFYGTNSHYCLSVIDVVDSLVLAVVPAAWPF